MPLEVLVERNGADSMHGAGPGPLRVPSFVDDCISAMKQMGQCSLSLSRVRTDVVMQICRSKESSERMEIFVDSKIFPKRSIGILHRSISRTTILFNSPRCSRGSYGIYRIL